jgi:putative oxygen-independent coproporphyrinogen III oxidase
MNAPLALYVHWPFCLSKCPYCDFNSHVFQRIEEDRFVEAILTEMRHWRERIGIRALTSIFFGGGTPSLMHPRSIEKILEKANDYWPFSDSIEITLEANPTSVEAEKFHGFRSAGINRLSLGVQSLRDDALKSLGREHDVQQALAAIALSQKIFPRSSFDLIYARVGQSVGDWEKELREALNHAQHHLSLYQLTLEPGTVFTQKAAKGAVFQASEDDSVDMYILTQSIMAEAGLPMYEVSNHAKPGEESRHNLTYWNYQEYAGIGPGAHGRVKDGALRATQTIRPPEAWMRAVEANGHGIEAETPLGETDQMEEAFLMGMRLARGLDKKEWQEKFGKPLDAFLDPAKKTLFLQHHFIAENDDFLRATPEGLLKLTSLTGALIK